MYSTQQLQLVRSLAEFRHFGRAAAAAGISQPALTKALRAMERQVGGPLFDRGPPVVPTALGDLVLSHGRTILAETENLTHALNLARGLDSGRLSIAAGGQVAEFGAIEAVGAFSKAHPFVAIDLHITDHTAVTRDVLEGRAELGIASLARAVRHDDLITERLRIVPYTLFCAPDHPLADQTVVGLEPLLDFPWIGNSIEVPRLPGRAPGRRAFGEVDATGTRVSLRVRATTFDAILRIVMTSQAISAAPAMLIARHVAAGRLHAIRAPFDWPDLDYGFILRRNRTPSPAALAYMADVRRCDAALG